MNRQPGFFLVVSLVFCLAIAGALYGNPAPPPMCPEPGYEWVMVFEDTFTDDELDTSKWASNYPWGTYHNHRANMRPEQLAVEGGELVITAVAERSIWEPSCVYSEVFETCIELDYTSGALHTQDKFWFKHGYVEGRFKIPHQSSTWPGFRMFEQGQPAAIDLLEKAEPYGPDWEESLQYSRHTEPLHENYHTYGMHWHDQGIDWYLDGQKTFGLIEPTALGEIENGMYMVVDLAVGGWADEPDAADYPAVLKCDWIRVWQQEPVDPVPMAHWTLDLADFQQGQYRDSVGDRHAVPFVVPDEDAFVSGVSNEGLNLADYPAAAASAGSQSPAASGVAGQMTVTLWAKWSGPTENWQGLVSKRQEGQGAEWFFQINPQGQWLNVNHWSSPSALVAEPPDIDQWVHFALTVDDNAARLYRDGLLDVTEPGFRLGDGTDAELVIGGISLQSDGTISSPFNGIIDEVRIYDYALTETHIADIIFADSGKRVCPEAIRPALDFTGDCTVGLADFALLARGWLDDGRGMPPE